MQITKRQLRSIIREEMAKLKSARSLKEAPMGKWGGTAHSLNMGMQTVKKALQILSSVPEAQEAIQHLQAAKAAIDAAWKPKM